MRGKRSSLYAVLKGYNVFCLPEAGGIQRYMEAFPEGGFFVGKNFVFDERVTVGPEGGKRLGRCLACSAPHDTYEPRRRCQHCRMLLLVCAACAAKVLPIISCVAAHPSMADTLWLDSAQLLPDTDALLHKRAMPAPPAHVPEPVLLGEGLQAADACADVQQGADAALLCELCLEKGLQADGIRSTSAQSCSALSHQQPSAVAGQNASLSVLGQIISVDQQAGGAQPPESSYQAALHTDPNASILHSIAHEQDSHSLAASRAEAATQERRKAGQARRLRILCLHGFRQSAGSLRGRTAALARKLADLAELVCIDAPHPLPFVLKHASMEEASKCGDPSEQELQDGNAVHREQRSLEKPARPQHCKGPCDRNQEAGDGSSNRWRSEACKSSPSRTTHACLATVGECCANGHAEDVRGDHGVNALAGSQPERQQKRYRRAWLLEPTQVPVSQASLMQAECYWSFLKGFGYGLL